MGVLPCPSPGSFPISPSSHCLVGLAEGVCCSLTLLPRTQGWPPPTCGT